MNKKRVKQTKKYLQKRSILISPRWQWAVWCEDGGWRDGGCSANQRPVFRSRDQYWPIRGQQSRSRSQDQWASGPVWSKRPEEEELCNIMDVCDYLSDEMNVCDYFSDKINLCHYYVLILAFSDKMISDFHKRWKKVFFDCLSLLLFSQIDYNHNS